MSKINIRESLNRLDIKTDNKYDLRNTYDCSIISDDKKKELAEALDKNASAKEVSKLLSEDYDDFDPKYDARYEVDSYYDNYRGLEDNLYTNDFEEVKDWVWEKIQNGGYIEVSDRERGKSVRLDPDNYDWESDDAYRVLDDLEELSPLNEDYGGAYDIDPEMFWTKDDLIEFSDAVCDKLSEKFGYQYDIADVGAESNNDMYILIEDTTHDIEADVSFRIKMSRIRTPRDLMKYLDTVVSEFVKKFEEEYQYYEFDESLKEENSFDSDEYEKEHILRLAKSVEEASKRKGMNISNLKKTAKRYIENHIDTKNKKELDKLIKAYKSLDNKEVTESLREDLDEEQLYKIVCKSGASEWSFESALSYEDAEKIVDYYNGRWIDEKGFEWSMEIEEDDESTERVYPFDESLKEGFSEVSGDFAFARKNWDKLGTGVSFDDALEEYNDKYGEEYFYAKPIYVKSAWDKMVSMFTESLKEAVEDEVDFDEFEETDFNNGEVEEGDTFIEDGREWTWIERIAGPIHLDFDKWSVWSARDWDYIQEKIKPIIINKKQLTDEIIEEIRNIYDEAEVAYFVVDEDTGFIDWGPVETSTEAQDFLNGKVEDYENDEEYEEVEIEEESLKESKDIEDTGYSVVLHYDDIGGGEEYDYEASWDDVVEVLRDVAHSNGDGPEDANEDEYLEWVIDNFDELTDKYELNVLDYFEDSAREEHSDKYGDEYIKDSETGSWYRR